MLKIPVPMTPAARAALREELVTLATVGQPGDSSGPQRRLFQYWTRGAGAAKIRWGTDGSFARCVRALAAKVPANISVKGLCANLHKRATGEWPTEGGKAGIPS